MGKDNPVLSPLVPKRRKSLAIKIGSLRIGGNNPVAVQSMAKTKTQDMQATLRQIGELQAAGCEIIRLAVRDKEDACAIKAIRKYCTLPLVADIHFDWRLAIASIDSGVDKIRLNPGNIYDKIQIKNIVSAAKSKKIPIRVGINSGSLREVKSKKLKVKSIAQALVKSALDYIKILEKFRFRDIVVSLKASNIFDTIEAYRKMAQACDYPLHLGLTATGTPLSGAIKSSIALGILLSEGIGDTVRVSLTDTALQEVRVAKCILESLNLRNFGPQIISCPTCGRCEIDLIKLVRELENRLATRYPLPAIRPMKVAVMGCVVNGPGEAREADLGVAFGNKEGLLFKKGKPFKKVDYNNCIDVLLEELKR